ncbi:MAG: DUF2203 domain-containing protein [Planctomycetota bacterium]
MADKLFTPAEASRTLPLVKQIVADILAKGKSHRELVEDDGPETVEKEDRKSVLEAELDELFKELDQLGCSFRDWGFEIGLVDFPAEIDGRPVLLCWRSDEPTVSFYHAHDAGYAGRKPIPEQLLSIQQKQKA